MLDLGGIPLRAEDRTLEHPLVIAGGPCAVNPEPMARFIDLFVIGDGEEALPEVCDLWLQLQAVAPRSATVDAGRDGRPVALRLRAAIYDGRTMPTTCRRCYRRDSPTCPHNRAGRGRRPGRHSAARQAGGALRRVRAGPHRHRDHARLSGQVPLLPEHDDQAAAAVPQGRNDRPGGPGTIPQHGLQRNLALVAFHQRLSRSSTS